MTDRPLVLNTRPRDQAAELSQALERRGFQVLEVPAVQVVPLEDLDLRPVLHRLCSGELAWTIVPSANAGRYLLDALERAGGSADDLARTRILCGSATATTLADRGLRATTALDRFSAADALRALDREPLEGRAILLPHARDGRDELAVGLRDHGADVVELVLYDTRPAPAETLRPAAAQLVEGQVAAVAFTSPSAVCALVEALAVLGHGPVDLLSKTSIVVIGETTADAVRASGLPDPRVAARTSVESLADAVAEAVAVPVAGARRP